MANNLLTGTIDWNSYKPAALPVVAPQPTVYAPIKTTNPSGGNLFNRVKNDAVSVYQHANPFSGVHDANKLIGQTQQQYGLTPQFVQTLHNANTSLTNKPLGDAAALTYEPNRIPSQVNRTVITTAAPKAGQVAGSAQDTVLHEGLHQVWAANPQSRAQFMQAYNQVAPGDPGLQKFLAQRLNVAPSVNLSNISKLPPVLQDEIHSAAVQYYINTGFNKTPIAQNNPLNSYYGQFLNLNQATKSNNSTNLPKGVNTNSLQSMGDNKGNYWYEDSKGNKYPVGVSTTPKASGGLLGVLNRNVVPIVKDTVNAVAHTNDVLNPLTRSATSQLNAKLDQQTKAIQNSNASAAAKQKSLATIAAAKNKISNQIYGYNSTDSTGKKIEKVAGNIGTSASLLLPGGGKALEALGSKVVPKLASTVANKAGTRTLGGALTRATGKGIEQVPAGVTFGASQAASQGQSLKQVGKSGVEGGVGAFALGAGASGLSSAIDRAKNPLPAPRSALDNHIEPPTTEAPIKTPSPALEKSPAKTSTPVTEKPITNTAGQGSEQKVNTPVNKANVPEVPIDAYHGSTNNKLTSLIPGAKTGLNEKRNLIYLSEDKNAAANYAKKRGSGGLGELKDSATGKVYPVKVTGRVLDAQDRQALDSLKSAKGYEQLSGKTKNHLTNDTGLDSAILEANPELRQFLSDNGITAVRSHLPNGGGASELAVLNPDKVKLTQPTQAAKATKDESKISGSALRTKQQAVEAGMKADENAGATYGTVSHKDEAAKAVKLLQENPARAKAIAMGARGDNVSHEAAVYHAVKNQALEDAKKTGDYREVLDLANSSRHSGVSEAGQKLSAEGFNTNVHDPVAAIQDVAKTRAAQAEKTLGKPLAQAIKETTDTIKQNIKAPTKDDWNNFVEGLKCK